MGIWRRIPGSAPWGSGRIHPDPHARSDGHEALPSSTSAHRGPVPEVEVGRPVKWSIVRLMPKKSMTRSKARTGRTRAAGMKRDRRGRISCWVPDSMRSEERRVGKGGTSGGGLASGIDEGDMMHEVG